MSGVRQKVGDGDTHSIVATVDGKEIIIASVWYNPKTHEGFHDARAIAALPALLALAEAVRDAAELAGTTMRGPLARMAEAALSQALGEGE